MAGLPRLVAKQHRPRLSRVVSVAVVLTALPAIIAVSAMPARAAGHYASRVAQRTRPDVAAADHRHSKLNDWRSYEVAKTLSAGRSAAVSAISCVSSRFCVAGGTYKSAAKSRQAFVSLWNGSTWKDHEVASQLNSGDDAAVDSVSCVSAKFCVAAGWYWNSFSNEAAFVSIWNGATWSDRTVAGNISGLYAGLSTVSCVSDAFCVAGGFYSPDIEENVEALVAVWNGSTWSPHEVAANLNYQDAGGGAIAAVAALSCLSRSFCVAGGYYTGAELNQLAFVSVWNGTRWSDSEVARDFSAASVSSVSCSSRTFCALSGYLSPSQTASYTWGFVSIWNGTSWHDQVVHPYLRLSSTLYAVSCSSSDSCVAGGNYIDLKKQREAFVSVWNGSKWTFVLLAISLNVGGAAGIEAVSCVPRLTCVASGYYSVGKHSDALVSVWNGATWDSLKIASSLGVSGNAVAVDCDATAGFCGAGGHYVDAAGHTRAFVAVATRS